MTKPISFLVILSALFASSLPLQANSDVHIKLKSKEEALQASPSRIPAMISQQEIEQTKKELSTRYETIVQAKEEQLHSKAAVKRYRGSNGIKIAPERYEGELLLELLPRHVIELGAKLKIRDILTLSDEKPVNTMLFHGPPGLGKTEAAAMLARDGGYRFVELPSTGLVDKYQNSGAERFQATIDEAIAHHTKTQQGSFIFMDEFDAIGRDINDADATMVTNHQTEQAALMHIWQTILKYKTDTRFVFCFATNKMKSLHKTFISRFREENIVEFKLPDAAQREIAFKLYLKEYDFSLVRELNVSEAEAQKTLKLLVKESNGMNLRAINDSVKSFKGQKSLSALSTEELIQVAKYLKAHKPAEFAELQKQLTSPHGHKPNSTIDAAIIAIHETLTGKKIAIKASTNKELYEIVRRTKAKDGYDWSEQMKRLNEKLSKNVDPWLQRSHLYYALASTAITVGLYLTRCYWNPNNNPSTDEAIQKAVSAALAARFAAGAAGAAAGLAGAALGSANQNGASNNKPPYCGPFG